MSQLNIDLSELFDVSQRDGNIVARIAQGARRRLATASGEALLDSFVDSTCRCLFWRLDGAARAAIRLSGAYRMKSADAGGWLLIANDHAQPSFWLPALPTMRQIDEHGRIFKEVPCPIISFSVDSEGLEVGVESTEGKTLDLVVWELGAEDKEFLAGLESHAAMERQPIYLWGSHGVYRKPADLYRNLIHGGIFDLRFSWPYKRRAYSENEAHALHLALRNHELGTGKRMYRKLRDQVLLSVLFRQDADGAWRQGIWSRGMERHFRLHNKAMHLLMDCYCEQPDEHLLAPLRRAADHISAQADNVLGEVWFLHDSLEQNEQDIREGLPGWRRCGNQFKTPANTLVLNTHIDTLMALHRFQQVSGQSAYQDQIDSARRAFHKVLGLKPAESLYRMIFGAIYLTLLPEERARALPLPSRALKRFARERLIPLLPALKCRFPRLLMPDGFVDRSISQNGLAHPYLGIHLMDFARYERCFPGQADISKAIKGMLSFAGKWDLLASWAEGSSANYGIGYWVEALFQLALLDERRTLRHALAETAILSERCGLGLPPSLAGRNIEMLPPERQRHHPITRDGRLRTINLARGEIAEYIFLNPENERIPLDLAAPVSEMLWTMPGDEPGPTPPRSLDGGQWVLAVTA